MGGGGSNQSSLAPKLHRDILQGLQAMQRDTSYSYWKSASTTPLHPLESLPQVRWGGSGMAWSSLRRKLGIDFSDWAMNDTDNVQVYTQRLERCLELSITVGLITEVTSALSSLESMTTQMGSRRSSKWLQKEEIHERKYGKKGSGRATVSMWENITGNRRPIDGWYKSVVEVFKNLMHHVLERCL